MFLLSENNSKIWHVKATDIYECVQFGAAPLKTQFVF